MSDVITEAFSASAEEAMDAAFAATCNTYQKLVKRGEDRTCENCAANWMKNPEEPTKCMPDCPTYQYINADGDACVADTCTQFERLESNGKCTNCRDYLYDKDFPNLSPAAFTDLSTAYPVITVPAPVMS